MFRSCEIIIRELCSLLTLCYSIHNSIRICNRGVVAAYMLRCVDTCITFFYHKYFSKHNKSLKFVSFSLAYVLLLPDISYFSTQNFPSGRVIRRLHTNSENRLLASWGLSVCLSACVSAVPTVRIFVKFITGIKTKICRKTPHLVKGIQQYGALDMKT